MRNEREFAIKKADLEGRMINDAEKNRIKADEEARKRAELDAQFALKKAELALKTNVMDTNIPGEVRTLE